MLRLAPLAVLCAAAGAAHAGGVCLPKSALAADAQGFDLGLVGGQPVVCAANDYDHGGVAGCWSIDAKSGALTAAAATPLPGHSVRWKVDAGGCVDGYCAAPKPTAGDSLLYATSADGANAVVLRESMLHVFDAKTKKQLRTIELKDDKSPDDTNVGNDPIQLVYVGDTIYVVGTDAGPYMAVWGYGEDGARLGVVKKSADSAMSVFAGGVSALDDTRIALADAGTQHLVILGPKTARSEIARKVGAGSCKPEDLAALGETSEPSKACKKTLASAFAPFAGVQIVALPSGELLMLRSGKQKGTLAVLDAAKLTEKKLLELKVCAK